MTTMWRCPDDGTCHHECERACFRVLHCAPFTDYYGRGPRDHWPADLVAAHRRADGLDPPDEVEVTADYPMRAWLGLVAPQVDEDARQFALLHFQQGHAFRVFARPDGGPVRHIECECGSWVRMDPDFRLVKGGS